jgi:hypothetical protein
MATAFENLAPRIIGDLILDLGLTAEQAAGIVGNLAAESGLLAIQERRPIRGRGGFGYAQWTGPRRVAFEKWAKQWGYDPTSYAANYGYILYELKNSYAYVLDRLRLTKTAKAAAETFGYHFEKFAGFKQIAGNPNYAARIRFAERALDLYRNRPKQPEPAPVPAPVPVPLPDPKPAVETKRAQGLLIAAIGLVGGALAKKWFPGSESAFSQFLVDYGGEITAAVGVLWSYLGQRAAGAPISGTPLAQTIEEAKSQIAMRHAEQVTDDEPEQAQPVSLFDLPMSVILDELPALLAAIRNVQPEQPKLLEHKPADAGE